MILHSFILFYFWLKGALTLFFSRYNTYRQAMAERNQSVNFGLWEIRCTCDDMGGETRCVIGGG